MKRWKYLVCALGAAIAACSDDGRTDADAEHQDQVGVVQLSLTGIASDMEQYRLRSATFDIQGTRYTDYQSVAVSVSSEAEVDSPVARAHLFYGSYTVSLRPDDWYLERITPDGAARVTRAVLLSAAAQSVWVQQGAVSPVAFQFGVDGELIDFLGGDVEIGISVQQAPDAGGPGG